MPFTWIRQNYEHFQHTYKLYLHLFQFTRFTFSFTFSKHNPQAHPNA